MWCRWAPWPDLQCQAPHSHCPVLCAVAPLKSQISSEEEAQLEELGEMATPLGTALSLLHLLTRS